MEFAPVWLKTPSNPLQHRGDEQLKGKTLQRYFNKGKSDVNF